MPPFQAVFLHLEESEMIILRRGSKGDLVRQLQERLKFFGLYTALVDGDFGGFTEASLMAYQAQLGVSPDGILGEWVAGKLGISIKTNTMPISNDKKKKIIVLTAGHSNNQPGAVNGKDTEHELMTKARDAIAKILRADGFTVLTDGEEGDNQLLSQAVKLVPKGDIAIELHLNGGVKTAKGIEALANSTLKTECQKLCSAINQAYNFVLRGDKGWKSSTSGQHHRLAFCEAGGIVLENFFITNDAELAAFKSDPEKLYQALADTIKLL
ncbi:N-acetylmuramoyl-L-alanine amidase [Acinetobacter sp. NIPH 1852]|uniref:N-acetylmuramoyl-L-alanine amidase n=1 Tax=Acinetobacter sp. NIPH 1852 TaxID=2923428 RepID=UPI001F4B542E|nr:N-acetylmuramoyl-L-alanine amidase [Acinetobacter sp. NIPH 1852]MCH7307554.1 N-acetylmuramoyl-L-alanine amidase [Acinetobacter sp. NIPH 1852]